MAVVVGGAQGAGRVIAETLLEHGAKVAIVGMSGAAGEETAAVLQSRGHDAVFLPADVTEEQSVKSAMQATYNRWGGLNVLVNSLSITGPIEPTDKVALDTWQRLFAINVQGPFLCTKHAIPFMRRTSGGRSIISVSSAYGLVGGAAMPSYRVAESAVVMQAKTDAVTYASEGIRVNAVCPGAIHTPSSARKAVGAFGDLDAYLDEMGSTHPLQRVGELRDVAYAVLYLASDESGFMTGTHLTVDGGYTAR